ncbi:hypothetical protein J5X84_17620 [Streptosporangiaceae bacterium NEAU-GS5]|nr:hypothetical protein [Streptosporangiaceae bacterium NEAU-GS5]
MSMRKLYAAGALAASVMALSGCGTSMAASRATPTQGPEEAPSSEPAPEHLVPSPLKSKIKSLIPKPKSPTPTPSGSKSCPSIASPQAQAAADAITVPATPEEAQTELQQLQQMGLYRPDVVAYSSNPVDAVKQVKERLEYGLIGVDGDLSPQVKEMLKTPQPTG